MRNIGSLLALIAILSVGSVRAAEISGSTEVTAYRLDRLTVNEIRATDLRNRLHDQHSNLGSHENGSQCGPSVPGSRLDADHPENGVLIPCRNTSTRAMRSGKRLVGKIGSVKPLALTTMDECSPRVSSKRKTSVSGWFVRDGRCRPLIKATATALMPTSKPHAQRRPVFGRERSSLLGIGGGAIAKPGFGARSAFRWTHKESSAALHRSHLTQAAPLRLHREAASASIIWMAGTFTARSKCRVATSIGFVPK
jgi:hypothetical protein